MVLDNFASRYSNFNRRTDNKRRVKLLKSYAPDWIITIVLAAIFFALNNVHGFRREFSVNDYSLRYPYAVNERVPDYALYIIAFVAPIIIQLCVNVITIYSFWDFHNGVLGHLLSRCIPISSSQDPTYGLSTDAICTQTDEAIMIDGWRSFPSGHSSRNTTSVSFAGLGFLAFYLAGKMHLFDKRGHAHKAWISVTPFAGATLVAISRTMDYRHHWQDVVAGAILGTTVAYFAYRQYYPSLASEMSHRPYSPRVPRDEQILPTVRLHEDHESTEGEHVELVDGGVCKPDPGPLEEIWQQDDSRTGPSALPESVLRQAGNALLDFQDTGIGIAEVSHRSKEFKAYLQDVESNMRKLLKVPDSHVVLFTQGGGSAQFSAVVLNMLARHHELYPTLTPEQRTLDYVVTGSWSSKAVKEAKRLGGGKVNVVADSRTFSPQGKFDNIPSHKNDTYKFSENPVLVYYCANETIDGVEFAREEGKETSFPFHLLPENSPLVGDYSSSFMSHPIPRLADHAIIYAGVQKNLGPAGLTVVIVRKDCIVDVDKAAQNGSIPVPLCTSYRTLADHQSLYNTPPVLSIYITGLVLVQMLQEFGEDPLEKYARFSETKSTKIYDVLKRGEQKGVFKRKVKDDSGSQMNVVFDVIGDGKLDQFIAGAEALNMKGLKGHRSVGGVRVSLYNAVTESNVQALVDYMVEFVEENGIIAP
ncbi:hypothetical protein ID866_2155 [Astraeus odoratus]|nr:hypothetical protein ID866_2155 [Astraeus odoratus]